MKSYWLNNTNNKNLIVIFLGWSFDENPIKFLDCSGYDILLIYDYNNLEIPQELKNLESYHNKILISWSMGVFTAYLMKDLFKNFNYKLAINGTVTPVDDEYGIPVKLFELTLKHAATGLGTGGKFYKNVFQTEEEFQKYLNTPIKRTIENRVSELQNLYNLIKTTNIKYEKFYDKAIVCEFDKIIPPKNQIASHKKNNVPIIQLPYGHGPLYNFESWDEVVKCK